MIDENKVNSSLTIGIRTEYTEKSVPELISQRYEISGCFAEITFFVVTGHNIPGWPAGERKETDTILIFLSIKSRNNAAAHFGTDHSRDCRIAGCFKEYMRSEAGSFKNSVSEFSKSGFFISKYKWFFAECIEIQFGKFITGNGNSTRPFRSNNSCLSESSLASK